MSSSGNQVIKKQRYSTGAMCFMSFVWLGRHGGALYICLCSDVVKMKKTKSPSNQNSQFVISRQSFHLKYVAKFIEIQLNTGSLCLPVTLLASLIMGY